MEPYAAIKNVWAGGPNSLTDPEDQDPLVFSKKELIEFGGADKEKINFDIEYDVTELNTAANISIRLVFDKTVTIGQTDLKSVQGVGYAAYRMKALPKYDKYKKLGPHTLDFIITLRKRFSLLDASSFPAVSTTTTTRKIILRE